MKDNFGRMKINWLENDTLNVKGKNRNCTTLNSKIIPEPFMGDKL